MSTNPSQDDDNSNKSVVGRVNFSFSNLLTLGVSFYTGDKAIRKDFDSVHNSIGASFTIDNGFFNLTAESAYSKFNGTEQGAAYAQVSGLLFGKLSPYYRFEYFDPNITEPDDTWKTHLFGLNFRYIPEVLPVRFTNWKRPPGFSGRGILTLR